MHDLRGVLRELLDGAGRLVRPYFGNAAFERKPDGSPVTEADRAAEDWIVDRLSRWFPDDSIISEEGARIEGRSGSVWHVDPIDGTGAFLAGLAHWGPTVCRVTDGTLTEGAFHVPRLGEHWYAEKGGGAWRDDQRLFAVEPERVGRGDVLFAPSRFHRASGAPWPGKVYALGSSAAHLALVAANGGLATVIGSWKLWDVGCGTLLVREAGRVIWGPAGEAVEPESMGSSARPPGAASALLAGSPAALRLLTESGWARAELDRATGKRWARTSTPAT